MDTDFKIPKSLRNALIAGEVVPFVGAGVSMTVKKINDDDTESGESLFPSWKGFVEVLAQALRDENKPDEADYVLSSVKIKKPKYLDALQHAQEQLGESEWYKLFNESFDKSKDEAYQNSFKLNELVWKLSNNLIITTNVDRVFQWTCPQPSEFKLLDVQNVEYAQLQKEKIPQRPTVWYLHGHIDHKEKVIFTREQFEAFYKQRGNDAKLQTLLNFLTQRTFLFIGFSLDDAYLREQLEYIHNIYKGGANSYYILLRERDIATANLPEYVKPIPFSDFGKPLEDLVAELARIAKGGDDVENDIPNDEKPIPPAESKSDAKKPFFNVQYNSKGKEFVGRVGKMEEIWNLLNKDGCASIGQAVSVKGFGGLGKTQLAVEYAHAYRGKYKNGVFWVVADENIDNQLLQIADKCAWINQFDKTVNQLDVAKARFLALSECLILFDNVEAFADIKDYLPKTNLHTHILITSREKISEFRQMNLELLERNESQELLLKISGQNPQNKTEIESFHKILEILGDIPLAIELVGGYLAEHENITFAKYHQFLDDIPLDKLEKEFPNGSFTNHDRSFIQTLRISEKFIKEKPLMVEILKVLAWSGNSTMGISLLQTLISPENEFEFCNALGDAYKLRLLKKDENVERYAIHRLLAKVIQFENPLKENNDWHLKIVINLENWFDEREDDFEYLSEFETELEHLETWQDQTLKILPSNAVLLTKLRAYIPSNRGNYQEAFNWADNAINLYVNEGCNNKELLANLYNCLGSKFSDFGNYKSSLKYFVKTLQIRRRLFGKNHKKVASTLSSISHMCARLENFKKELKYELKAFKIREELFGENHIETARSLNCLGHCYNDVGNPGKGLTFQLRALKIRRNLLHEKHADIISSLHNIAITYQNLGNYQESLNYNLQNLTIRRELFGNELPNIAPSLFNAGINYSLLGNYKLAIKFIEEALIIFKKFNSSEHPDTIQMVANLITLYWDNREDQKAIELAREFLIYAPKDHPQRWIFEKYSFINQL